MVIGYGGTRDGFPRSSRRSNTGFGDDGYGDEGYIEEGFGGPEATVLKVVHTTVLNYSRPVIASYNEARMRPVNDARQFVRRWRLEIKPNTWIDEYHDFWGTAVTAFEVLSSHKRLRIVAEAVVEIHPVLGFNAPASTTWEELGSEWALDGFAETLTNTPTTAVPEDVAELARNTAGSLSPRDAAEAVCLALRDQLEYVPGSTTVHTAAAEAWENKRGVCQDMAHLCIGALRTIGIPARYVSGYLHPNERAAIGEKVRGDSHAWLEFWAGEWIGYDPTNRKFVSNDHIVVARGREYADVAPLKGVYAGAPESQLAVTVEMTRLA